MTSERTSPMRNPVGRIRRRVSTLVAVLALVTSVVAPVPTALGANLSDFGEPFHFLAPLAPEAGDPTRFDASLLDDLVVEICRVEGTACTLVKTLTSTSNLSERLRIGPTTGGGSYYLANWDVSRIKLTPYTWRVSVTIAGLVLGQLDVGPNQYKSFGRTWPIKFRIEKNPTIWVRILRSEGKSASQVANVLKNEFALGPDDIALLLARDIDRYTDEEIELALKGVFQTVVVPPTTKIADQATQNALTTFDPATGRMTCATTTPILGALNVGDVMVGEPNAAAPNGYLRYVTAIAKPKKGPIVVDTRQALINEVITEGTLDAADQLDLDDLDHVVAELPGVTFSETPSRMAGATAMLGATPMLGALDIGDGYTFHETFDVTLDGAGKQGGVSGRGTVRIQGEMNFNAGWNVGFGVEECFPDNPPFFTCVDRFEAHLGMDASSKVTVTGNADGHIEKEYVLSTHYFKPIIFFIGPIPVVLVPIVKAVVGATGDAHLEFSFDAEARTRMDFGAKWTDPDQGGNNWQDINDVQEPTATGHGDLEATMELRAYAKMDAKLLLYGILGPGLAGRIGVGAIVKYPGTPLWKAFAHARGEINFAVDLGGIIKLSERIAPLPELTFQVDEAENQPPVCGVGRDPIPVDLGVETFLGPRGDEPLSPGFFDCSDPEGGAVTFTTATSGGPQNAVSERFDAPGGHDLPVTVTDPAGLTTLLTLHIEVNNEAPFLETATATGTVPASTQYFVTAAAWDIEDRGFVPCTSITWTVTGGTFDEAGDGRACTIVVVFDTVGAQTVHVVAVDKNNKPSETTLTVNVTAPPSNDAPVIDPGSFFVNAAKGPKNVCVGSDCDPKYNCITGEGCRVPYGAILYNGAVGTYHGPLTFGVSASDPNGDTVTVTWFCKAGETSYPVTANGDGTFTCDPFTTSYLVPINVWAEASDGTTTVRSEVRRLYMYNRVR